ncbi:hypothetical protein INN71_05385 [Nocardioides sp. ChNu-153]|uniref:hypothetical protein n=1 Tax=unclassified Nocardioides TaxID=2615069 RepID=UPI0024070866|nr:MULTISPECIES: hypothetical protein [unclassified Nocardioides]MDF9715801.1 hypothetical protein [Nocardioides sp. ChNu-99]MDN7120817.1 hypothetical protein [Nocardioides sp. ChNu-153]
MARTSSDNAPDDWWFCLKHHTVEPRKGCRNADRLGPFATREEAAGALERVAQRNEAWEAADDDEAPREG